MAELSEIGRVLRLLGVGGNCSGHRLTAAAVALTLEEPDRPAVRLQLAVC